MDWFEHLFGFRESGYTDTQRRFAVNGEYLHSLTNDARYRIGTLELVSLQDLRSRVATSNIPGASPGALPATPHASGRPTRLRVHPLEGDVRKLHQQAAFSGALFQVASQFNLLEMVGPDVFPEDGVTRYVNDRTQGPACAMAAGAATLYRNYLVPVNGQAGQTGTRQLNGLADLGAALAVHTGLPEDQLWTMRNGYCLATRQGLEAINTVLAHLSEPERDSLRTLLRIGLHWNVEVTDLPVRPGPLVSQAFCSAVPVAYSHLPKQLWAPLATLVLEAAYEATLLAALCGPIAEDSVAGESAARHPGLEGAMSQRRQVLLTRLGGGAFGNDDGWIDAALWRALRALSDSALDVHLVSYRGLPASAHDMASAFP